MQRIRDFGLRFIGLGLVLIVAAMIGDGCMFAARVQEDPGTSGGSKGTAGTGGLATAGGKSGASATGGSGEIITKDAGTCIREPGEDTCMEVCKIESHLPERLPPDILLVLDRSLSMNEAAMPSTSGAGGRTTAPGITPACNPPSCQSKWTQVSDAIVNVVMKTDKSVIWGLKYFGSNADCDVAPGVDVPLALGNYAAISTSIKATMPISRTPTRAAMNAAATYLQTLTQANPKYIVLATDGQPTCGSGPTGADDNAAIAAVAAAYAAGFPTFVVGISTGTMEEGTLNSMAKAGGVPRPGVTQYYPVSSSADLQTALTSIAGNLLSCTYPLAPASGANDPNNIAIHIAGGAIQQDQKNGWDFTGPDHTAVKLYGTACGTVMNGSNTKVEVFYGCPGQPPVP